MADARKPVTAAEMDAMTPSDRAEVVDAAVVRDWNEVPEHFRRDIVETAKRLVAERRADA
jgi:hypothetical protein